MSTSKKKEAVAHSEEQVIVTGQPVGPVADPDAKPFDPAKPLENVENPLESEFFEDHRRDTLQPAGVDERLQPIQSDGKALSLDPEGGSVKGASVGDEVLYCRGMKETGEKEANGNRILEPDYAPATIYQVDDERKATGHVLLVFASDDQGGKQAAWAHNASGVPGYWTRKTREPK